MACSTPYGGGIFFHCGLCCFDADHLDSDIVVPAALFGEIHQLAARVARRIFSSGCEHFLVVNQAVQAVGAKEQHVSCEERHGRFGKIGFDGGVRTEGGGENVFRRMRFGLFGGNHAIVHHLLDVALVAGQLNDDALAQQIQAGVTYVAVCDVAIL